jgi:hypothetical protein
MGTVQDALAVRIEQAARVMQVLACNTQRRVKKAALQQDYIRKCK